MKNLKLANVGQTEFKIEQSDYNFTYQEELTNILENTSGDFTQDTINQIVLWKVNRYAQPSQETMAALNALEGDNKLDPEKTSDALGSLLNVNGIRLAMASTFLHFRNPKLYQIIDQRVYRLLYGEDMPKFYTKSLKSIEKQITLYLTYLDDLRKACGKLGIPFDQADKILYMADKRINKEHSLSGY